MAVTDRQDVYIIHIYCKKQNQQNESKLQEKITVSCHAIPHARCNLKMEYSNVGASHTGHRDVLTTSNEMHLIARSRCEYIYLSNQTDNRNSLVTEYVSAHRCRWLTAGVTPTHPTIHMGNKYLRKKISRGLLACIQCFESDGAIRSR